MSKKHGITALPYMSKKKHGNNHSTLKKNSITTILCTKTRYYQGNIYKKNMLLASYMSKKHAIFMVYVKTQYYQG